MDQQHVHLWFVSGACVRRLGLKRSTLARLRVGLEIRNERGVVAVDVTLGIRWRGTNITVTFNESEERWHEVTSP